MEEKLLEVIETKITNLRNSKKECETAIEEILNEKN